MNRNDLKLRAQHVMVEMGRLAQFDKPSATQKATFDALAAEFEEIEGEIRADRLNGLRAAVNGTGRTRLEAGAFGAQRPPEGHSVRDQALRTIDARRDVADATRHLMASTIDQAHPAEVDRYARYIRAAGSADYESAFGKILRDPMNGHRMFSQEELAAFQQVQYEARALNLTDANGGYLVPANISFDVILTNAGSVNPVRRLARNVTTTGDSWSGITSAGSSASWDAEAAQVSADDPTFAQPTIPVHKGACYIQASFEVAADASIGNVLGPIFADARDQLEATAFTLGTGTGQPLGIITAIVAAGGGSVLTSAGSALSVADVTANQNSLSPRFRARAVWMANLSIINQGRQLPLYTNGPALVSDATNPPRMSGWEVYENSNMDGTIAAGTTADYVLLSGDFSNFVVADRIGLTVAYNPMVVGANGRPTGEVGWYAYWRAGSGLAGTADAFRLTNYSG